MRQRIDVVDFFLGTCQKGVGQFRFFLHCTGRKKLTQTNPQRYGQAVSQDKWGFNDCSGCAQGRIGQCIDPQKVMLNVFGGGELTQVGLYLKRKNKKSKWCQYISMIPPYILASSSVLKNKAYERTKARNELGTRPVTFVSYSTTPNSWMGSLDCGLPLRWLIR